MKCPHCDKEIFFSAIVPDEQDFMFSIEKKDGLISSQTLAGVIKNMDGLMRQVARDMGHKVVTFVRDIESKEGSWVISMRIVSMRGKKVMAGEP